ncbi:MAG: tetratricopeptide repeat protein [Rhodoferax sp.]|nr:tetratricopeptide repeat protein [Rhodoferax sp.]
MKDAERSPEAAPANLADAWALFDKGRLDAAIALARQVIEQSPAGQPHADAALGWFLLSAGSVDEAEATLTSSLGLHPGFAPLHWYLGLVYVRQGRREEACQALATSVTIDPELDEAAVTLAWVLGDLGRFAEATLFSRAALAKKTQLDRMAQLGWLLVCQEQWEEAVSQLSQVLSLEPARLDARSHLATALQRLGRSDEALQVLADGLALSPDVASLLLQRIHLLLELHRPKEARDACRRLLALQPREGTSWFLLALTLVQRKRPGVAARALARARRLAPVQPEVWTQTAWLALEAGDLHAAREAVERVLALAPEDSAHQVLAAAVMEASGNLPAASEHAEEAVARAQGSAAAWRALAQVRSSQGRLPEAEVALQTALALDPRDANDTYRQLGWLCLASQRPAEAISAFSNATGNNPLDAESLCGLAEAYRADGKLPEAMQAIRKALLLRNDWPTARTVLSHVLIDSGPASWDEAVRELTKALAQRPAHGETRRLLADVLHRLGRSDDALNVLVDGLALTPAITDLWHQEIRLLLALRRTKDARAACHSLLRQQPRESVNWYLLALVLEQHKQPGIAARALHRALRWTPESHEVCRQIGWLSLKIDSLPTARQAVDHLLALAPADTANQILAAFVMDASGNHAAASQHAENAVAHAPHSAPAWRTLAQVRARQGRNDEARKALRTALAMDPVATSDSYRQLGWICRDERRYGEAIAAFRAAVANNPKDASSWYGLADAYRADGKFVEALQAIKPTLTLREEWNDRQLRGQIIHEQVYGLLKKKWNDLGGPPQPLLAPPAMGPLEVEPATAKKYDYVVCSLSTKSHVPLMNTLANSVRRHFSGRIYLLVVDSDDSSLIPEGTTLVRLSDVIDPSVWQDMVERYNILELCCALKSFLMRFLARTVGCPIIYMDADTYMLGPMDALLPERPDFSVFLTPHLLYPFSGELHAEEIGMLCVGVYNGGMIGVGMGNDGIRFLDWWLDRVTRYAYDSREQGVFTDQKWLDLVPCFFKDVQISRAPGLNLGHWRVCSERDFALDPAGKLTFCGAPITVMHMSGFKSNRPDLLAQHLRPPVIHDTPLGNFLQEYAQEVIQNRH